MFYMAEFEYYKTNQKELVKKYGGRIIAIKGCSVVGVFSSDIEAITEMEKKYALGTFMIQRCADGKESYTATVYTSNEMSI